jgi:hypothetical protein
MSENPENLPAEVPDFLKRDRFHPDANIFPLMPEDELAALTESIKEYGLIEPIIYYKDMILDGRNRFLACQRIDYQFQEHDKIDLSDSNIDPFTYVVAKNITRRHLTADDKRRIIKELLTKYPTHSSRWIAELAKVSHHTVEKARTESEATAQQDGSGQTAQLSPPPEGAQSFAPPPKRKGKDGKSRRQGSPRKPPADTPAVRKKQIDAFKAEWDTLNSWQRRYFVKTYIDEIKEIVGDVESEISSEQAEAAE